jgi:hypothetical protein
MGRPGSLDVLVVDERGEAVPGADVDLLPAGGIGTYTREEAQHASTDEAGIARFPARPPGDGWVLAASGRRRTGPVHVVVPSGSGSLVNVTLAEPASGRIEVEVLEAWYEVSPDVRVLVESSSLISESIRPGLERQLALDPAHRAVFDDVPPGVYAVTARLPDGDAESWRRIVLPPGATVTVRLPAP